LSAKPSAARLIYRASSHVGGHQRPDTRRGERPAAVPDSVVVMVFTDAELAYLRSQRLGRLATVAPDGTPQNNPVGFEVDGDAGTIIVRGRDLGNSRKFRNVQDNGKVAFVVDDIVSTQPWVVRCLEIRGTAEALTGQEPPNPYFSHESIVIHPRRIIGWGLGEAGDESSRRTVEG
jgi:pyridoxamine 5'-phosphate oxidase family protein